MHQTGNEGLERVDTFVPRRSGLKFREMAVQKEQFILKPCDVNTYLQQCSILLVLNLHIKKSPFEV